MTKVALQTHEKDLMRETPNIARERFLYHLSRSDYEREWGTTYTKPDFGTRVLSALLRYLPKVGPFKGMEFDNPTPQTEDLYIKSINTTLDHYEAMLEEVRKGTLVLPNCDLDDGKTTNAGEYTIADETYARLLAKLTAEKFDGMSPELRDNILTFYSDLSRPIETRRDPARWQAVLANLDELKTVTTSPIAAHRAL